jgi:hypothetical protein
MASVINTFDKGLHQDSTFVLQPDGTYRNLKNGMLISHDGNHYVIELSQGNKCTLTLPKRYIDGDVTKFDAAPMPIAFISYLDKLAVLFTNDETDGGGYGELGLISFTRIGNDFISTYTPYYHHSGLNFSLRHMIEGFSFEENDLTERIYFSDNNNEPRVFDFTNPIFTDYKAAATANELENGKQYMVLQGCITYNGDKYAPHNGVSGILGNIFTATTAGGSSYTVFSGTPLVIEYYPLSLLDWTPSRALGNITFKEYGSGNKNCGSSIYFYRLSSSYDGVATTWSYASNPIHIGMDNEAAYLTSYPYNDFVGNGSTTTLADSSKSVKLTISNIDTDWDTIEVAVAEFTQQSDIPYLIKIFNKSPVTATTMTIEDIGTENLGTVTIADLTLFPASILKCKTLTTNKNYIIIANTTERAEFELDLSGVTATQFEYPLISHGDITNVCTNGNIPEDQSPDIGANPGAGDIKPFSRYLVSLAPDAGNRVEYPVASGTYYYTGDVFVGVAGSVTATFTGTAQARPCTTRNRYTKISDGSRTEDAIELTTGFWDYKDPAVASHNKGYWSEEKYRLAFIGFDLKGNPFYSKHITDFTFSNILGKSGAGLMRKDAFGALDSYSLNPSAINISGLDIPESVMDQMSGFSIVRAERDPIIITQGLLMQNVLDPTVGANRIMPLGVTRTNYSAYPPHYLVGGCLVNVLCPDWLVSHTPHGTGTSNSIGNIGDTIREACWLDGTPLQTFTNANSFASKMFDTLASDGQIREKTLQSMNGLGSIGYNEHDGTPDVLGDGKDFFNRFSTLDPGTVNAGVDSSCTGAPAYISPVEAVGCKKLQIYPQSFNHYGPMGDYNGTSVGERTNWAKLMVNFITDTDPNSLYGGSSDQALANTLYMSTGHFQPINAQVKADTVNGVMPSGTYAGEARYTFNNIEIFGGDCFTNLIDIGYGLWKDDFPDDIYSYSMWFPCECNVNYNLRRGRKVSNVGLHPDPSGGEAIEWMLAGATKLEDYSYNKAYSTEGTFIKYPALPVDFKFTGRFPYRSRFAGFKYPGEIYDSFRKFLVNDYKDLDGKLGEINNVRSKDGRTIVWQNHGVSSVPILERQLLSGTDGASTTIGTGGVIDRFDPISSTYGNQHQHGLVQTEYGYAWFDMRNRALCIMSGNNIQEISLVKGLQTFFNSEFNEGHINGLSLYSIYNTNDSTMAEVPLLGYGIIGVYDPKFKMTYMTFKYRRDTEVGDEMDELVTLEAKDFTIGYSHVLNAIVGFYDFCPAIWHNHNDLVLSSNNSKNRVYYGTNMPSTDFVISNTISVTDNADKSKNGEYVCIQNLTVSSYPATGIYEPTYLNSAYWVKTNDQSQIWLQSFNTEYLKFYGQVYGTELEIIVNPKVDQAFTPQSQQIKGSGTNFNDVICTTDNQTASDTNISSTNRNYREIDSAWFNNLPLPTNGRLTDYYTKVKYIYKGYVSNPTTSKNTNKVLQWIKTIFVTKK